jgi:hypothetical protein
MIHAVPDTEAAEFLLPNAPRFECSDPQLEEVYVDLLDAVVANHEAWSRDGAPKNRWQMSRRLNGGRPSEAWRRKITIEELH